MENDILINRLEKLKKCLLSLDINNIRFFNKLSQYLYITKLRINGINLNTLLDEIYCSIPLLLSDEALDVLMDSLKDGDLSEFERVSKVDFFNYATENLENWEYIVTICTGINTYLKAELSLL